MIQQIIIHDSCHCRNQVDGKEIAVASVHLSWWDKGFQQEWARLEERFSQLQKPLILAGDFNNPAGQEGV